MSESVFFVPSISQSLALRVQQSPGLEETMVSELNNYIQVYLRSCLIKWKAFTPKCGCLNFV